MGKLIYDKQMLALWLEIMSFKTKQDGFSYKQKLISVLYLLAIHSFSIANKLEPIPAEFTTNVLSNVTFLSRYFFEHWWQACGSETVCGSCERQTVQFWFMVQRFSHNQRYVQVGVILGDVLYKFATVTILPQFELDFVQKGNTKTVRFYGIVSSWAFNLERKCDSTQASMHRRGRAIMRPLGSAVPRAVGGIWQISITIAIILWLAFLGGVKIPAWWCHRTSKTNFRRKISVASLDWWNLV